MSAFAAATEIFGRLLKAISGARALSSSAAEALHLLQPSLAADLEGWLRLSHPMVGTAGWLGPDLLRAEGPLTDWVRLQGQFAVHWNTIARTAGEKLTARLGTTLPDAYITDPRKLYALWIDCAEDAYAQTARSEAFCRSLGELINATVALRAQATPLAQSWAQLVDLPTRREIDELKRQVEKSLRPARRPAKRKGAVKAKRMRKKRRS